jgi:hypothetical protein
MEQNKSLISKNRLIKFVLFLFMIFLGCIIISGAVSAVNTTAGYKTVKLTSTTPTIGQGVDNTKLSWKSNGTGSVKGETSDTHDGVDAVGVDTFAFSEFSTAGLQTTVNGPGTINFYWTKSWYATDDIIGTAFGSFSFTDNGRTIYKLKHYDKNMVWSQKSYTMGTGIHHLSWFAVTHTPFTYPMSWDTWSSMDGYVDQVKWIPAPKVSSTTPPNFKTGVSRTSTIVIKFSENIKSSTYYSSIKVKNLSTGKYVTITKSISGVYLNIKTSTKRSKYTWYQVTIPKVAVKDAAGNNLQATYTFKFKTGT